MIRFGIIKYKYVKESTLEWFFLLKSLYCQWLFVSLQQQNPPRFPLEQRTRAGLLLFMSTLRLYTKQALSISEQIELLKSRGLNIADSSKAEKFLGEVSYFRFVQYLRPMEADKTTHQFKPNSRFEEACSSSIQSSTAWGVGKLDAQCNCPEKLLRSPLTTLESLSLQRSTNECLFTWCVGEHWWCWCEISLSVVKILH